MFALGTWTQPDAAQRPVRYEATFPNALHHEAEITLATSGLPVAGRWAMSPMIRPSRGTSLPATSAVARWWTLARSWGAFEEAGKPPPEETRRLREAWEKGEAVTGER